MTAIYREHELFGDSCVFAGLWEMNGDSQVHGHDFLEIAVIGAGTGRHVSARGAEPLILGDVIVLRPGTWHGLSDCDGLLVANCCLSMSDPGLAFLYDDPALRDLLWLEPMGAGRQGIAARRVPETQARQAIGAITAIAQGPPRNRALVLGGLLTVLGSLVVSEQADSAVRPHPAVAATLALLEAHPERDWRLADLSTSVALDQAYLSRLFQRHTGQAPMTYLARLRAERAAELLARTTEPISRIGARVGWPDPTYFARRFRTLVGMTPNAYRQRARHRAEQHQYASLPSL